MFHDILPRGHSKIMLTRPIKAVVFDDRLGAFVVAVAHDSTALHEEMYYLDKKRWFISSLRDFSEYKYPNPGYNESSGPHTVHGTVPVHTLLLFKAHNSPGCVELNEELTKEIAPGEWQFAFNVDVHANFCDLWFQIRNHQVCNTFIMDNSINTSDPSTT